MVAPVGLGAIVVGSGALLGWGARRGADVSLRGKATFDVRYELSDRAQLQRTARDLPEPERIAGGTETPSGLLGLKIAGLPAT